MSISVVIPAYNAARYIAETLESVLGQTLPPDEVIVVDDESSDGTVAIAESFAPRVKVFRQPNQKQAIARNFGVSQSSGEWIAFVDADDVWEPTKLERQMQELARHPEADLCYTGMVWLMQEGETVRLGHAPRVIPADEIQASLLHDVSFLPSSVVMRRTAFDAVGGFDPRHIYGNEDHDLWLRLRQAGTTFVVCPEPLMRYRRHPNNTSKGEGWFKESLWIYENHALPYLPKQTQRLAYNTYRSGREADLAYTLRTKGDPRHLGYMAASLLHRPFHEPKRYKVLAHMIYSRLRGGR